MVLVQKWPFFQLFVLGNMGQENVFRQTVLCVTLAIIAEGAFVIAKIFGNFQIEREMKRFGPCGDFPIKWGPPLQKHSRLTSRSVLIETCRSISKNSRFQSFFAKQ